RPATLSVGLVSPRSTWLNIGADTVVRSARSLSDRPMASRRALTRGPKSGLEPLAVAMLAYVITYVCIGCRRRGLKTRGGRLNPRNPGELPGSTLSRQTR